MPSNIPVSYTHLASTQRTIPKRKRQFSSRLHIPESFFDEFLSTQLDALKKCREEFRDCYGDELIEKFKQNGYAAMEAKIGRCLESTQVYIHKSNKTVMGIKSPLDHPVIKKRGHKSKRNAGDANES